MTNAGTRAIRKSIPRSLVCDVEGVRFVFRRAPQSIFTREPFDRSKAQIVARDGSVTLHYNGEIIQREFQVTIDNGVVMDARGGAHLKGGLKVVKAATSHPYPEVSFWDPALGNGYQGAIEKTEHLSEPAFLKALARLSPDNLATLLPFEDLPSTVVRVSEGGLITLEIPRKPRKTALFGPTLFRHKRTLAILQAERRSSGAALALYDLRSKRPIIERLLDTETADCYYEEKINGTNALTYILLLTQRAFWFSGLPFSVAQAIKIDNPLLLSMARQNQELLRVRTTQGRRNSSYRQHSFDAHFDPLDKSRLVGISIGSDPSRVDARTQFTTDIQYGSQLRKKHATSQDLAFTYGKEHYIAPTTAKELGYTEGDHPRVRVDGTHVVEILPAEDQPAAKPFELILVRNADGSLRTTCMRGVTRKTIKTAPVTIIERKSTILHDPPSRKKRGRNPSEIVKVLTPKHLRTIPRTALDLFEPRKVSLIFIGETPVFVWEAKTFSGVGLDVQKIVIAAHTTHRDQQKELLALAERAKTEQVTAALKATLSSTAQTVTPGQPPVENPQPRPSQSPIQPSKPSAQPNSLPIIQNKIPDIRQQVDVFVRTIRNHIDDFNNFFTQVNYFLHNLSILINYLLNIKDQGRVTIETTQALRELSIRLISQIHTNEITRMALETRRQTHEPFWPALYAVYDEHLGSLEHFANASHAHHKRKR